MIAAVTFGASAFAQTRYTAVDLGPAPNPSTRANSASVNQQVGYTFSYGPGVLRHALLWSGSAAGVVDLHPSTAAPGTESGANGVSLGQQVGFVGTSAALWNGTPDSFVNLHPTGYLQSTALKIRDTQIVGVGVVPGQTPADPNKNHAILWTSPAPGSIVDLNPGGGWTSSYAYDVEGGKQVGAIVSNGGQEHAVIWFGSPKGYTDLHTSNFITTQANAISAGTQVGSGFLQNKDKTYSSHALMWKGSASSVVDLHVPTFPDTYGLGAGAGKQVGFGVLMIGTVVHYHALVWSGTTASMIDLNNFIPTGYTDSEAYGVDEAGNIVGLAGDITTQTWHAMLWIPMP